MEVTFPPHVTMESVINNHLFYHFQYYSLFRGIVVEKYYAFFYGLTVMNISRYVR